MSLLTPMKIEVSVCISVSELELTFMKFDAGKFYEKLSSDFHS